MGADHSKRLIVRQAFIAELNEAASDGTTALRRIVREVVSAAENGDVKAAAIIFDRVDGKPSPPSSRPASDAHAIANIDCSESPRERIGRRLASLSARKTTEAAGFVASSHEGDHDFSKLETRNRRTFATQIIDGKN
jgi:hypothetical protein